jgi:hypothetical protein
MWDADQLHERVAPRDVIGERAPIEWIARDGLAAGGNLGLRAAAGQRPHPVTALDEQRQKTTADVSGPGSGAQLKAI